MNDIRMKTKRLHSLTLALILILGSTIFGTQPSYAALIYGDVSQDGEITAYDAALAAQYSVSMISLTADQLKAADVSGENQVTAFDAALIAQYVIGLIDKFPVEDLNKILVPGTGWTGQTEQPDPIGNPTDAGYDAKAIARWDVVPYQTFDGNFNVGVVAFHINDIDRVEFSVNNGPWLAVNQMTLNSQTANHSGIGNPSDGVMEYWATLDASKFTSDGPVEVRAVVYPKVGIPRVLQGMESRLNGEQSLILNANAQGTLPNAVRYISPTGSDTTGDGSEGNPYQTPVKAAMSIYLADGSVDGATIYMMAGSYNIVAGRWNETPLSTTRWMTLTRAPGLSRSDVTITGSSKNIAGNNEGLQTKLVRVTGITMTTGLLSGSAKLADDAIWYDDVNMIGPGRWEGTSFRENQFNFKYITNSNISAMQDAPDNITLYRNVRIDEIAQSGVHNSQVAINVTMTDNNRGPRTTLHPDAYQFTAARYAENAIAYGVVAQEGILTFGIRMQPEATDVAIVNCIFDVSAPSVWELERPYTNIYVKDSILTGAGFHEYPTFVAVDLVFENCTFSKPPNPWPGMTIK